MVKSKLSLAEFLEYGKDKPYVFYNAFQRGLAAINRYGRKDGRWQFLIKQKDDERNINTRFDSSGFADEFVSLLKRGARNPNIRNKIITIIAPPGAGKSDFVNTLVETMRVYSETDEGTQYLLKLDLDGLSSNHALDDLGDIRGDFIADVQNRLGTTGNRKITLAENIQDEIYLLQRALLGPGKKTGIEDIIDNLQESTNEYWQGPTINKRTVGSSTKDEVVGTIVNSLKKYVFREDGEPDTERIQRILENLVSVEKATDTDVLVVSEPVVMAEDQHVDFKGIFGGKMWYKALNELSGDNSNVLAYNFGVLGDQSAPSPRGNIIHLSEVLKGSASVSKTLLDFTQDMRTKVSPSFKESFDAVIVGTTNMDDYKTMTDTMKPYLLRRLNIIVFRSMTKMSDAEAALENIYTDAAKELDVHYPPHFLRMLARVWVEASLSKFENITLKQKADLYDGMLIPEIKVSLEDIIREATQKPLLELEEGVKLGVPYDDLIKSPDKLRKYALFSREMAVKSARLPKEELDNKVCLATVLDGGTKYLEDFLNTLEDLSSETKTRLQPREHGDGATIISDAYGEIKQFMKTDVSLVEYGEEKVYGLVNKYVINVYYMEKLGASKKEDKSARVPMFGVTQALDYSFVTDLEKRANIRSDLMRESIYGIINDRAMFDNKKSVDELVKDLTPTIIQRHPEIVKAVVEKISTTVASMSTELDQDRIIKKLKGIGYCDQCARVAYNLFTNKS